MYRYAAIYQHDASPRSQGLFEAILGAIQRQWPGWNVALKSHDLQVLEWTDEHSRAQRHDLHDNQGVIFGYLFTPKPDQTVLKAPRRAPGKIDDLTTAKIVSTGGEWLRDHYWGSYVAILRNEQSDGIKVFRGPFARIGCFHFKAKGVSVLFSDVRLLSALKEYGAEMDWSFAPIYLGIAYAISEKTAFSDTDYLVAGQCVEITARQTRIYYLWDPASYAAAPPVTDVRLAREGLRNVALSCMDAWASAFPHALLLLSGGFDSSALAGLLAKATNKPEIVCVTHYSEDVVSDERHYARLTAEKWRYKLVEIGSRTEDFNPSQFLNCPQRPWPVNVSVDWSFHRTVANLSKTYYAPAILTGEGGDAVFVRKCGGIAGDYVFDHGLGKDTLKVAFAAALVDDKPVWRVLSEMIMQRLGMQPRPAAPDEVEGSQTGWGLRRDIADQIATVSPAGPWNNSNVKLAPGKKFDFDSIMFPFYEGAMFDNLPFVERLEPILSQPLVETALRIPTYIHQHNGRERGLAREAFADCLTDEVRLRRYKSLADGFFHRMLIEHKAFYKDFLLGGILAEKNIFDKDILENALNDPALETSAQCIRILRYADVEAWARSWN